MISVKVESKFTVFVDLPRRSFVARYSIRDQGLSLKIEAARSLETLVIHTTRQQIPEDRNFYTIVKTSNVT